MRISETHIFNPQLKSYDSAYFPMAVTNNTEKK